ncbi:23S rRNA (uracil(1939)-C(5))-methyltransferase RlmD [Paenibacillus sp. N4]|uniref:23S rRNA (uracil(1939)-C(5))-methyltransferase RlmD n=1 Tax=Paenibacillus vietnamensis TaxID=2590547 RepID=UPI001CD172CF|nr:23S rRNA (uracil(1939)-C(5))-methyltransferase RlmD [Paenibacillus vietnamensis]MCA0757874.1 23S rRNA (uracil(1939)-C(5))-methyltransferase RlmD [Paenibacillus vietnamensis]
MHKGKSRGGKRGAGKAGAPAPDLVDAPYRKNELVTADIIGLTHDGEGVGRADGFTLFIQGALPGERVRAKVMKVKKQYGYARLEEILEASPSRIDVSCGIYKECGGCQLQHFDYDPQLEWKRQHVVDNLVRIGKLRVAGEEERGGAGKAEDDAEHGNRAGGTDAIIVHPTIGMDEPWRYRNKAAVPVGRGAEGEGLQAGFYARGSHRIIDMDDCLIQHELNDEVIRVVKRIGRELEVSPYDEETGRGVLRHVMARTGVVTGEIMVVLVTNSRKLPSADRWVERIREEMPAVKSIVQNVNERKTNVIFGDETRVLWGSEVIYDELDGIRFAISARSFYQVNPLQTVKLYRKAVEYAGLTGTEDVIDAYCGIGTISLFLARKAGRVYGVEIVPEAIEDAARNAELNGIKNATFEAGPAEVVIPRWREEGVTADIIVVDPPRKGCDQALLETILAMEPKRVVYVSCNPSTLARDLRVLEDGGYRTVEVTPVDMFPWTTHVECCSLLVRKDN